METKHTKKEMEIVHKEEFKIWVAPKVNHATAAAFYFGNHAIETQEEAEANAKLFCASHAILEALQNLLVLAESGYSANVKNKHSEEHLQEDRTLLMKAREAIKLATE